MTMTKRRIAAAVGAVVLVAGVVAGRERASIEAIQERAAPRAAVAAADGIDLTRLDRAAATVPRTDPFSQKNFSADGRPAAAVSEKPTAPPLPFQYFGRITENGRTDVFVMRGDELLAIAPGQTLGEYRVDKIGATSIAFTYLPLKTKQTLDFQ